MSKKPKNRRKRWLIAGAAVVLLAVVAYPVVGFWVLPAIVRSVAEKQIAQATGRQARVEKVRMNPFLLTLDVEGVEILEADGREPFVSLGSLHVDVRWASLWRLSPVVQAVRLEKPYAHVARRANGAWNFADLGKSADAPPAKPTPEPAPTPSEPFRFSVANIAVQQGELAYEDAVLGKAHRVDAIELRVPLLSNLDEEQVRTFVEPHFSARVDGKPLAAAGKTKPFAATRPTALELTLSGLDLPYYYAYAPPDLGIDLTSGTLDLAARMGYEERPDGKVELVVSAQLTLRRLEVRDKAGAPLVSLGALEIDLAPSKPLAGQIHIKRIGLDSPTIALARDPQAGLNVLALAAPEKNAKDSGPPPPPPSTSGRAPMQIALDAFRMQDARVTLQDLPTSHSEPGSVAELFALSEMDIADVAVDMAKNQVEVGDIAFGPGRLGIERVAGGDLNLPALAPPAAPHTSATQTTAAQEPPAPTSDRAGGAWQVALGRMGLTSFTIDARDLAAPGRGDVRFDIDTLEVAGFSTAPASRADVRMDGRLNETGLVSVRGQICPMPFEADLALRLDALQLPWAQPFADDFLNADLASGRLATSATVALKTDNGQAQVSLEAGASLSSFSLRDRRTMDTLAGWADLRFQGVRVATPPLRVEVERILLDRFETRAVLEPDGSLNLARIAPASKQASPDAAAATQAESAPKPQPETEKPPLPDIRVGRIEVRRSAFEAIDRTVAPAARLTLSDLTADLGTIGTAKDDAAELSLTAKVQRSADLSIGARATPWAEELTAQAQVRLNGMDLDAASPYSGKFIGYEVGAGKLFIDLDYRIEGARLESRNKMVLDQFDFGRKVDSPDAAKLPVKTALAILKDRHGKIVVDVPVSGRLDDPEFHFWGAVTRALVGLVTKAATSPFSAIASLVGSEEDLRYVVFEPGRSPLGQEARAKLDLLADALYERPGLRLDISGFADPAIDRPAIAQARFDRLLRVEKARALSRRGKPPVAPDSVRIEGDEERRRYLEAAWKAADFEKPTNALGFTAAQPPEEMERMLRAHIQVGDEALGQLAKERAQAAQAYLVETDKVEIGRLFLVKRTPLSPEPLEAAPGTRVELGIR